MRVRLKNLITATALVLVAGGSLSACSDDGSSGGVGEESGTALTRSNFLDEITQAQTEAGSSHIKMAVDVAGQKLEADGDIQTGETMADSAMAMTMNTGQAGMGSLEMRLVDQIFYLNFGPMTDNKFAEIDLTDKDNPIGKQYSEIVSNLDPAQQLKQFEGAVTSFEKKGKTVSLDGVDAQPYVVVIDTSKMSGAAEAPPGMPKTLEYTMYIGPDNLPRRVLSQLPAAAGAGGGEMKIDYSKWGEKVSITKPDKAEITDKDFLSQLGGASPAPS
ncbi:hypothetical protein [Aeromicrobium sp.]|uniref:hypothetical protein n=1 Tax=Aeromicrobium sp. TaxID=1871063 RepID=UPI003D6A742C